MWNAKSATHFTYLQYKQQAYRYRLDKFQSAAKNDL